MKIGERNYELAFTGETLLIFKENFHTDFINLIADTGKLLEDYELLFGVLWSLIKDRDDLPPYREFMKSLKPKDMLHIINIDTIKEIVDICNGDMETEIELKKKRETKVEENL